MHFERADAACFRAEPDAPYCSVKWIRMGFCPGWARVIGRLDRASLEKRVIEPSGFGEHWDRLADLSRNAEELLAGLDELGMHQAAAYVSMALDFMRQSGPGTLPSD
jgi:hypothetical protein